MAKPYRLYGIRKDLYDIAMEMWKDGKTAKEIAKHLNQSYQDHAPYSYRTIGRVIYFARLHKDPRAVYHVPEHISPIGLSHAQFRS